MNRTAKKCRYMKSVACLIATLFVMITAVITVNASDVQWEVIQSGNTVDGAYTPFVELSQLEPNGLYRLELSVFNEEVIVDVNDAFDVGSLWLSVDETVNFEGTPEELYSTIAIRCDPPISTEYGIGANRIRFYGANFVLYEAVEEENTLVGLIGTMFSAFGDTISGLANGVKGMFGALLFTDGALSPFAKFGFLMMGLSMALGLGYFIIRKIRG